MHFLLLHIAHFDNIIVLPFSSVLDILLSILFSLLLVKITILLCFFFLFLVVFNNFSTSPVDNENARLRLALAITAGAPITVANDAIEMLPLVAFCCYKIYQNNRKKQYTC